MNKLKGKNRKKCKWFLDNFCCRDLDGGRIWECPPKYVLSKDKKTFECEYYN